MYYMASTEHLTSLTAPPLGAWLLGRSIWAPFQLAIALALVCYTVIWTMPETLQSKGPSYILLPDPGHDLLLDGDIGQSLAEAEDSPPEARPTPVISPANSRTEAMQLLFVPNLFLCFILFFVKRIAFMSDYFWYQYASERFHWQLRQTAWLRVSQAVGASLVTAGVLPYLTTYLLRKGMRAQHLDLKVIKISLLFHIVGFFGVWVAGTPVALGIGE